MLSENVAYVARLLKEGRGKRRGSECDIEKNRFSIVHRENLVTFFPPPPPFNHQIEKNPFPTPLVESTFGGIYDYQFEQ